MKFFLILFLIVSCSKNASLENLPGNIVATDPLAFDQSFEIDEDSVLTQSLPGRDIKNNELQFELVSSSTNGTVNLLNSSTGVFQYTPNLDYNGEDSFSFKVLNNKNKESRVATIRIVINPLNDNPISVNDSFTVSDSGTTDLNVLFNDSDVDGDSLSISSVTQPANGSVSINPDNTLRFTGVIGQTGSDSFSYAISDGNGGMASAVVNLTISPSAVPPVAMNINPPAFNEDTQSIVTLSYTDANNDPAISCSIIAPSNVTVSQACSCTTGVCTVGVTGTTNYFGSASFQYTVSDGTSSNSATANLSINPVDDAPVSSNISPPSFSENTQSIITLAYTDVESHQATACTTSGLVNITVSQACSCSSGVCTVGVTGNLHYNGPASFQYSVTANSLVSNISLATLTINSVDSAPVANNISPAAFNEDTQSIITLSYVDDDNDQASSCSISATTNVSVTQACVCSAGVCTVGITGSNHFFGAASFQYTVTANSVVSNSATASLNISSVDDAPVSSNVSATSFDEDTQSIITLSYTDADSDLATACSVSSLGNVTETQACSCAAGVCTVGVTGLPNYFGAANFNFNVTANGVTSNTSSVSFMILSTNDAPVANNIFPASFNEDTQSIISLNYTDTEGDQATTCSLSDLSGITITQACSCAAGFCSVGVTGNTNFFGSASFNYTVFNGLTSNSASATFTILPVDDAPVSSNISPPSFNEDTQSIITLSYTDTESDLASACSVSSLTNVSITQACSCAAGVCTLGVTGTTNYFGSASFQYSVTANSLTSNLSTANLTINSVNDSPVTSGFTAASINEDTQNIITLSYTDAENDLATACSVSALSNATVTQACSCSAGVCTVGLTGTLNFFGTASFNYVVLAGSTSNSSSVSYTINAVNDAPAITGTPISVSTDTNTVYNGTLSGTDVENDTLTFSLVTQASNGTAVVNANGTYSYTPNNGYSGSDSFVVRVYDGVAYSSNETVSVTVNSVSLTCPPNYKKIAANTTLGTDEFCIMSFEAKNSGGVAASIAGGSPWVNITPEAAKTACESNGAGYDLISNREWLATAYLIENRTENWSTGVVGGGVLNRGHSDNSSGALSVTDTGDFYNQTGNSIGSGWDQRRTFYINDTDFIWDFSGNVWEWVDWTAGGVVDKGFTSCSSSGWFENWEIASNCAAPASLNYTPLNPAAVPNGSYGSSYNIGTIFGTSNAAQGIALRGGAHNVGGNSGIYSMALDSALGETAANVGFRCVYRGTPPAPSCPSNYEYIAANATLGTGEFCVMKYEARLEAGNIPSSKPDDWPWAPVTGLEARTACQSIGANADIISNREWMAISYLIENRPENWVSGVVGTGGMVRGHSDGSDLALTITNTSDHYNGTGNSVGSGPEQRRTFYISATNFLWDFGGNQEEWVDWTTGGSFNTGYVGCSTSGVFNLSSIVTQCPSSTPSVNGLDYLPINTSLTNASNNIGRARLTSDTAYAGGALRGGHAESGTFAGIYALDLSNWEEGGSSRSGFRCVIRFP